MEQRASIKYHVFTSQGGQWIAKGFTNDRSAAMAAAKNLAETLDGASVKIDQEFFDAASMRTVTTTIFNSKAAQRSGQRGGGTGVLGQIVRWAFVGLGAIGLGFGMVIAARAYLL